VAKRRGRAVKKRSSDSPLRAENVAPPCTTRE
jgi:hypothetical protein